MAREWSEEQKQAARERMALARMAKKAKQVQPTAQQVQQAVALLEPSPVAAPDLVLTFRRLRVGSFTGLWEICKVMPDGTLKVLPGGDANTKQIIMNLARNEIAKCGL